MENAISIISDACGILGFLIGLFAVNKIYRINKIIKDSNNVKVSGKTNIGGDFVGRDKTNK